MAEIAGLVIGGISLTALFGQCISTIKYVDSGTNCNKECLDAALMLTLLGGRLNRWERTVREAADLQTGKEDGEDAETGLKRIRDCLEEAEKLSERYAVDQRMSTAGTATKGSTEISRMLDKLCDKLLMRNDGLSIAKRARWALCDQDKMRILLDKLDKFVSSLEKIFPSQQTRRSQMAKADFAELLASGVEAESPQALVALRTAAERYDEDLNAAASSSSHIYREIDITGGSIVNAGDYYSEEWEKAGGPIGRGGKNVYHGIRISGNSDVNLGNMYGGSSVFEIRRR